MKTASTLSLARLANSLRPRRKTLVSQRNMVRPPACATAGSPPPDSGTLGAHEYRDQNAERSRRKHVERAGEQQRRQRSLDRHREYKGRECHQAEKTRE